MNLLTDTSRCVYEVNWVSGFNYIQSDFLQVLLCICSGEISVLFCFYVENIAENHGLKKKWFNLIFCKYVGMYTTHITALILDTNLTFKRM